jgi:hypothetical protein
MAKRTATANGGRVSAQACPRCVVDILLRHSPAKRAKIIREHLRRHAAQKPVRVTLPTFSIK